VSDQTITSPVWEEEQWVDVLKQFYHTENEMAVDCVDQKDMNRSRIHRAKSGAYALILSTYYRAKNQPEPGKLWEDRAIRQNQRAFGRSNKFVASLGLEMP
jgi:hypothetical protein